VRDAVFKDLLPDGFTCDVNGRPGLPGVVPHFSGDLPMICWDFSGFSQVRSEGVFFVLFNFPGFESEFFLRSPREASQLAARRAVVIL
jgi:hypothetical protein